MLDRELAQHYVLEIRARADTVRGKCSRLLEEEFFSEAPRAFIKTIREMCGYLAEAAVAIYDDIDWSVPSEELDNDLRILQNTDHVIKVLAKDLRYAEGARTDRLPWSIVASFEDVVATFLPNVQIMLRAMWTYNYAFHLADQGEMYRRYLRGYHAYLPHVDVEAEIFPSMAKPFHIISFPSLEQKHILLHCLLGHEVGHLLVHGFLTNERASNFLEGIRSEVHDLADQELRDLPVTISDEDKLSLKERLIAVKLQEALFYWRRALEEFLSDSAGILLFGPAALLATLDVSIQSPLDVMPSPDTDYYPPWRSRLRHGLELLDYQGGWFPIPGSLFHGDQVRTKRVADRFDFIRSVASKTTDRLELNKVRLAHLAYREVGAGLSAGLSYLMNDCGLGSQQPVASHLYSRLPFLVDRLDHKLPPNAIDEHDGTEAVASFAEIINAAWFAKISLSAVEEATGRFAEDGIESRNLMNNLTLKAVEFAHLATRHRQSSNAGETD